MARTPVTFRRVLRLTSGRVGAPQIGWQSLLRLDVGSRPAGGAVPTGWGSSVLACLARVAVLDKPVSGREEGFAHHEKAVPWVRTPAASYHNRNSTRRDK